VVNVTNRSHIHVRLRTIKFFLRHNCLNSLSIATLLVYTQGASSLAPAPKTLQLLSAPQ
jgi:hypothetical protein